jgi:hypothetical protein
MAIILRPRRLCIPTITTITSNHYLLLTITSNSLSRSVSHTCYNVYVQSVDIYLCSVSLENTSQFSYLGHSLASSFAQARSLRAPWQYFYSGTIIACPLVVALLALLRHDHCVSPGNTLLEFQVRSLPYPPAIFYVWVERDPHVSPWLPLP